MEGGLWQKRGRGKVARTCSIVRYITDLTNVQTGLQAEVAAGQFTDANTVDHVNTILADLTTALSAGPQPR